MCDCVPSLCLHQAVPEHLERYARSQPRLAQYRSTGNRAETTRSIGHSVTRTVDFSVSFRSCHVDMSHGFCGMSPYCQSRNCSLVFQHSDVILFLTSQFKATPSLGWYCYRPQARNPGDIRKTWRALVTGKLKLLQSCQSCQLTRPSSEHLGAKAVLGATRSSEIAQYAPQTRQNLNPSFDTEVLEFGKKRDKALSDGVCDVAVHLKVGLGRGRRWAFCRA